MNYKKGFLRLFVIGLIAAPTLGIFMNGERYTKQYSNNIDLKRYAVEASKMPRCAAIIAQNPIKFPDLSFELGNNCLPIVFNWDEIKRYQAAQGNINAPVTEQVIRDAMDATVKDTVSNMRYGDMLVYTIYYLFFSFVCFVSFVIIRWIIKGFKSS